MKTWKKVGLSLAAAAGLAFGASCADFEIDVDLKAPAIKDVRKTNCGTTLGFNGGLTEFCNPHWVYQEYPDTDRILATTIPGEPPLWRESAWEDTMGPGWFADGVNGEWRPRRLHPLTIKIAPNTIQSVRIPLVQLPQPKK